MRRLSQAPRSSSRLGVKPSEHSSEHLEEIEVDFERDRFLSGVSEEEGVRRVLDVARARTTIEGVESELLGGVRDEASVRAAAFPRQPNRDDVRERLVEQTFAVRDGLGDGVTVLRAARVQLANEEGETVVGVH